MILLRLLSAGKTLVGVGQGQRSYRLPEGEGLPRFNSKKNPFRPADPAAPQPIEPVPKVKSAIPAAPAFVPRPVLSAPKGEDGRPGWLQRTLSLFRKPAVTQRVRPSQVNGRPCQGELRLESVRVVRNDLSETEPEAAPRMSAVREFVNRVPGSAAAAQARKASETAWNRVSARIFGSDT